MKLDIPRVTRFQLAERIPLDTEAAHVVYCALSLVEASGAPGLYLGGREHLRLLEGAVHALLAEVGPSEELCSLSHMLAQAVGTMETSEQGTTDEVSD